MTLPSLLCSCTPAITLLFPHLPPPTRHNEHRIAYSVVKILYLTHYYYICFLQLLVESGLCHGECIFWSTVKFQRGTIQQVHFHTKNVNKSRYGAPWMVIPDTALLFFNSCGEYPSLWLLNAPLCSWTLSACGFAPGGKQTFFNKFTANGCLVLGNNADESKNTSYFPPLFMVSVKRWQNSEHSFSCLRSVVGIIRCCWRYFFPSFRYCSNSIMCIASD